MILHCTSHLGYPQYPYMPAMVAQYYGYPPYPPQYYPVSSVLHYDIQFGLGSSKSKRYQ